MLFRRIALAVVPALLVTVGVVTDAPAKGGSTQGQGGNSGNAVFSDATWSADCTDFSVKSTKDISHVEYYQGDDEVYRDESPDNPRDYRHTGDVAYTKATVKAGTKTQDFPCTLPELCDDTVDNNGDGVVNEGCPELCDDTVDNNGNGVVNEGCPELCDDTVDNNGNGVVNEDCVEVCDDGIDNDVDGDIDEDCAAEGHFSCRASALRITGNPVLTALGFPIFEPFVANPDEDPCADDGTGDLLDVLLAGGEGDPDSAVNQTFESDLGTLDVGVLYTRTSSGDDADAAAGVLDVVITSEGAEVLSVSVLTSWGKGTCANETEAGHPLFSGSSILSVKLEGVEQVPPGEAIDSHRHTREFGDDPDNTIIGDLFILHLNETDDVATDDGRRRTQRAFWLETKEGWPLHDLLGDIVIGESVVDYHGETCS